MPSRIDETGPTKAFDYPVAEHWGETEMFTSASGTRTDNTSGQLCMYISAPRLSHDYAPALLVVVVIAITVATFYLIVIVVAINMFLRT